MPAGVAANTTSAILPHGLARRIFFASPTENSDAAGEFLDRVRARLELVGHVAEPDDGAGDELREHGDEAGEVDEVADRARIAAIDIDRVAHGLEGVEADAERQRDAQGGVPVPRGQSERSHQGVVVVDAEVEVLEEPQQRQVADHRHRQGELLAARSRSPCRQQGNLVAAEGAGDPQAHHVIHQGGAEHQENKPGIRPAVEEVAEERQSEVPHLPRRDVVDQQNDRQEIEDEQMGTEDHNDFSTTSTPATRTPRLKRPCNLVIGPDWASPSGTIRGKEIVIARRASSVKAISLKSHQALAPAEPGSSLGVNPYRDGKPSI